MAAFRVVLFYELDTGISTGRYIYFGMNGTSLGTCQSFTLVSHLVRPPGRDAEMRDRQTFATLQVAMQRKPLRLKTIELGGLVVQKEVLITTVCTKETPKPPAPEPKDSWALVQTVGVE